MSSAIGIALLAFFFGQAGRILSVDPGGRVSDEAVSAAEALPVNPAARPDASAWRAFARESCGANCCYLLLRLHGAPVTPGLVRDRLPGPAPTTMLELKSAARSFGVEGAVIQCRYDQLRGQRLPLIARLGSSAPGEDGHFVVVTRCDGTSVDFIDGTTALSSRTTAEAFSRAFSGHAFVVRSTPDPGAAVPSLDVLSLGLAVLVAGESSLLAFLWIRRR